MITLKSILATQDFQSSPNAVQPMSQVILWTNPSIRSLENDPLLAPLLYRYRDRLSLRIIDLTSLTKNTPLQGHHLLNSVFDKKAWLDGDLIRVLLLWHYGGFWIDMDNLLLRDLRILGEHEWVVQWDCYGKKQSLFKDTEKRKEKKTRVLFSKIDIFHVKQISPTSHSMATLCISLNTRPTCAK
jgi:hypothetical protein